MSDYIVPQSFKIVIKIGRLRCNSLSAVEMILGTVQCFGGFMWIQWLQTISGNAVRNCLLCIRKVTVTTDNNEFTVNLLTTDTFDEFHSRHSRHSDICNNQVRLLRDNGRKCFLRCPIRADNSKSHIFQRKSFFYINDCPGFIIDDNCFIHNAYTNFHKNLQYCAQKSYLKYKFNIY